MSCFTLIPENTTFTNVTIESKKEITKEIKELILSPDIIKNLNDFIKEKCIYKYGAYSSANDFNRSLNAWLKNCNRAEGISKTKVKTYFDKYAKSQVKTTVMGLGLYYINILIKKEPAEYKIEDNAVKIIPSEKTEIKEVKKENDIGKEIKAINNLTKSVNILNNLTAMNKKKFLELIENNKSEIYDILTR